MKVSSNSCSSAPAAAPAVPAGQPDRLQEPGDPQLQEGQRRGQQQDEVRQDRPLQHHRGRPLHPGGVLLLSCQEAGHADRPPLAGRGTRCSFPPSLSGHQRWSSCSGRL